MSDDDKKNELQNKKETEKKLFQIGGLGGPGRGNTRKHREISKIIEAIKALAQEDDTDLTSGEVINLLVRLVLYDTTSKDQKNRTNAVKQFVNLLAKKIEMEEKAKADKPFVDREAVDELRQLLIDKCEMDVIKSELCDECLKKVKERRQA